MQQVRGWIKAVTAQLRLCGAPHAARQVPTVVAVGDGETVQEAAPEGWRVLQARTVPEACKLLEEHEAQVAVCDGDALQSDLKRAIRQLASAPSRPCVIVLTRAGDLAMWEYATALGAYDLLRKPVSAEALNAAVRAGASHWRSSRALEASRRRA